MKKLFILFFIALIGISLSSINVKADNRRTIPMKHGVARGSNTTIVANGGTLYMVSGYASSSSCRYSIHDASSLIGLTSTTRALDSNTMAEGGEGTQYDGFPLLDFGSEGITFNNGLSIVTSTCDVAVAYR